MEMSHVFLFAFFFSLLLIFTLVAASISHSLTAPIKFSCFSSNENGFLCLSLALALLSSSRQTLKFSPKKDSWGTRLRCCCFFSLPKSQGGHAIYHRNARVLDMRNLPLSYMKGWTYVRTIFSEIRFLGCIDSTIFLPVVLLFAHLKRESEADDNNNNNNNNNNTNNNNNNNNYSNNKIIMIIIMTNNYNNKKVRRPVYNCVYCFKRKFRHLLAGICEEPSSYICRDGLYPLQIKRLRELEFLASIQGQWRIRNWTIHPMCDATGNNRIRF